MSGPVRNKFHRTVLAFYEEHGRHTLPWRKTKNPYRILVSEVMLQQTQVGRVVPYYEAFLKRFPTVAALAEAPLGDVLRLWQGLGYNRRAKMLHSAAQDVVTRFGGRMPRAYDDLLSLPGVGEYTAKAVRVFAYNKPEVMIETNIRAVFLHHFFKKEDAVPDAELLRCIAYMQEGCESRTWYAALMDYGSYLKKQHPNPSRKSAHHTVQKTFKGSDREIRGALIRSLGERPQTQASLMKLPFDAARITEQIEKLKNEGMVKKTKNTFHLP